MANQVFVSPGVYTSELDLTYVTRQVGVTTLGLVGETTKGPAFQPIFISDYGGFQTFFGGLDNTLVNGPDGNGAPLYELPYIAKSYLSQSNQLFVTRILGLSGYHAGLAWGITLSAALDPTTTGTSYVSTYTANYTVTTGDTLYSIQTTDSNLNAYYQQNPSAFSFLAGATTGQSYTIYIPQVKNGLIFSGGYITFNIISASVTPFITAGTVTNIYPNSGSSTLLTYKLTTGGTLTSIVSTDSFVNQVYTATPSYFNLFITAATGTAQNILIPQTSDGTTFYGGNINSKVLSTGYTDASIPVSASSPTNFTYTASSNSNVLYGITSTDSFVNQIYAASASSFNFLTGATIGTQQILTEPTLLYGGNNYSGGYITINVATTGYSSSILTGNSISQFFGTYSASTGNTLYSTTATAGGGANAYNQYYQQNPSAFTFIASGVSQTIQTPNVYNGILYSYNTLAITPYATGYTNGGNITAVGNANIYPDTSGNALFSYTASTTANTLSSFVSTDAITNQIYAASASNFNFLTGATLNSTGSLATAYAPNGINFNYSGINYNINVLNYTTPVTSAITSGYTAVYSASTNGILYSTYSLNNSIYNLVYAANPVPFYFLATANTGATSNIAITRTQIGAYFSGGNVSVNVLSTGFTSPSSVNTAGTVGVGSNYITNLNGVVSSYALTNVYGNPNYVTYFSGSVSPSAFTFLNTASTGTITGPTSNNGAYFTGGSIAVSVLSTGYTNPSSLTASTSVFNGTFSATTGGTLNTTSATGGAGSGLYNSAYAATPSAFNFLATGGTYSVVNAPSSSNGANFTSANTVTIVAFATGYTNPSSATTATTQFTGVYSASTGNTLYSTSAVGAGSGLYNSTYATTPSAFNFLTGGTGGIVTIGQSSNGINYSSGTLNLSVLSTGYTNPSSGTTVSTSAYTATFSANSSNLLYTTSGSTPLYNSTYSVNPNIFNVISSTATGTTVNLATTYTPNGINYSGANISAYIVSTGYTSPSSATTISSFTGTYAVNLGNHTIISTPTFSTPIANQIYSTYSASSFGFIYSANNNSSYVVNVPQTQVGAVATSGNMLTTINSITPSGSFTNPLFNYTGNTFTYTANSSNGNIVAINIPASNSGTTFFYNYGPYYFNGFGLLSPGQSLTLNYNIDWLQYSPNYTSYMDIYMLSQNYVVTQTGTTGQYITGTTSGFTNGYAIAYNNITVGVGGNTTINTTLYNITGTTTGLTVSTTGYYQSVTGSTSGLTTVNSGIYQSITGSTSGTSRTNSGSYQSIQYNMTGTSSVNTGIYQSITGSTSGTTIISGGVYTLLIGSTSGTSQSYTGNYQSITGSTSGITTQYSGYYQNLTGTTNNVTLTYNGFYSSITGSTSGSSYTYYGDNAGDLTGLTTGISYAYTGSGYSDVEGKIIALLRSRATVDVSTQLPTFQIANVTDINFSSTATGATKNPLGIFNLTGTSVTQGIFNYELSFDVTKKDYVPRALGRMAFDKKTSVFVEEFYGNVFTNDFNEGKIYGINQSLINYSSPGEFGPFDNYLQQYQSAVTPYVVSEVKGNQVIRLFRFWTISDGNMANMEIKVSIANIRPDTQEFDVQIRDYNDTDARPKILEAYSRCNLDPTSNNYIGQLIGTYDGAYASKSSYVLVELDVNSDTTDAFPAGFVGYPVRDYQTSGNDSVLTPDIMYYKAYGTYDNPRKFYLGLNDTVGIDTDFFDYKGLPIKGLEYSEWTGLTPGYHMDINASAVTIADIAEYINGGSGATYNPIFKFDTGDAPFQSEAGVQGTPYANLYARKFTLVPYGGFDGWDIYRTRRTNLDTYDIKGKGGQTGLSYGAFSKYPLQDGSEGLTSDYYAYLEGIWTFINPEANINVFATPGIDTFDNQSLVNQTIEMVENNRADSLYIVTTPDSDSTGTPLTVSNVVDELNGNFDSNYTATYWPWVQIFDSENTTYIYVPPTRDVVRNIALTDNISFPWFAVAGVNRGSVDCIKARVKLTQTDRDTLYENRINPIATFASNGVNIWGNKTLQVADTYLNRINIRRLLLQARKLISAVSIRLLFEQNDAVVRNQFLSLVNPILDNIRSERGLSDFRVVLNNSPEDFDNNQLTGQIFLKPTTALEFIQIQFVILPSGASFDNI